MSCTNICWIRPNHLCQVKRGLSLHPTLVTCLAGVSFASYLFSSTCKRRNQGVALSYTNIYFTMICSHGSVWSFFSLHRRALKFCVYVGCVMYQQGKCTFFYKQKVLYYVNIASTLNDYGHYAHKYGPTNLRLWQIQKAWFNCMGTTNFAEK